MANMAQQAPHKQASAPVKDTPFFLHHAIFLPFSRFPPAPAEPLTESQRNKKIIQNLIIQQDAVRRNMVFLAKQRSDNLRAEAKNELLAFEARYSSDISAKGRAATEEEVNALISRLKTPPMKDAKPEDFYFKPGGATSTPVTPARDAQDDIDMNGDQAHPVARTATFISEELNRNLRELTEKTIQEIHSYNRFCETSNKAKLSSIAAVVPTTTPMAPPPPRGILKVTTCGPSLEGTIGPLSSATPISASPDSARSKIAMNVSFGSPVREMTASPVVDGGRRGSAGAMFASAGVAKENEGRAYNMKDIARRRW
ncbi:hypothetical protein BJ875DRAFT_55195 [Amylocarpus encephaloides]|uniref:Uncharacterized protein n=1 Tax=Amylocarpus encephaloides TaxID=45428 RepID=A0A9P7YHF2_9HELO|nr:hypothetical protein BJ875DRAFT_55195 [Amylocarpus encephaloides]